MDFQDIPEEVYREKYLKYKKKYLELSQTAAGATAGNKQAAVNAKKAEIKKGYAAEMEAVKKALPTQIDGATDEQKVTITTALSQVFGSKHFKGMKENPGLIEPAIEAIPNDRTDLVGIYEKTIYDNNGKAKLNDKIAAAAVVEAFSAPEIATQIIEAHIKNIHTNMWKEYKFKSDLTTQIDGLMKEGNLSALKTLNAQIELDAVCKDIGIKEGFAICRNATPDNIGEREQRELGFKTKYEKVMGALNNNQGVLAKIEAQMLKLQNAYNDAKETRDKFLEDVFAKISKKPEELKADHKSDDTIEAWNKNKDKVQTEMDAKSCKDHGVEFKGKCETSTIIEALKKEFINKKIDVDETKFTSQVGQ